MNGPFYGLSLEDAEKLAQRYKERKRLVASCVNRFTYLLAAAIILPLWAWWPYRTDALVLIGIVIFRIAILPSEFPTGRSEEARKAESAGFLFASWGLLLLFVGSMWRYWT